ncbi:hypothetical protein Tco_0732567 [Tanacetum coccineum]
MSKSEKASVDRLLDELDELARTKCSTLDAFADKNADSDPLVIFESVPELVAEELKATLPVILIECLKNAMPQIVAEFVKQTIKKSVKKAIPKFDTNTSKKTL